MFLGLGESHATSPESPRELARAPVSGGPAAFGDAALPGGGGGPGTFGAAALPDGGGGPGGLGAAALWRRRSCGSSWRSA